MPSLSIRIDLGGKYNFKGFVGFTISKTLLGFSIDTITIYYKKTGKLVWIYPGSIVVSYAHPSHFERYIIRRFVIPMQLLRMGINLMKAVINGHDEVLGSTIYLITYVDEDGLCQITESGFKCPFIFEEKTYQEREMMEEELKARMMRFMQEIIEAYSTI